MRATAAFILTLPSLALAANGVRPGELIVEPPTLISLGFEWPIEGDDNRDAAVEVAYRRVGDAAWKKGHPLLRIGGERVFRDREYLNYTVPHGFAGSVFDLEPGTEYEVRFTMKDPDGVSGEATKTARVRTRVVPQPATGGRVLHVYPPGWTGPKQEPAFSGLKEAYHGPGSGDWAVVRTRPAQPGDTILVHAGLYKADRFDYVTPYGIPFDGTYTMYHKGTAEKPITIKAAGDGEAIFDGAGNARLFDVAFTAHHIFDGLTIRNTDVAFWAGTKGQVGAVALTVRNCRIEDVGMGITTENADSKDFYIADNIILGRDDPRRLVGWSNPGIYGATPIRSYIGVKVYGSGHVVAHNGIAYFHDAICISTYGHPEPERARKAVSIDFYNNDIHVMADNFIETDGGVHNLRVMRNRGVNSAHGALSSQPVFGGPAYFIRNVTYHSPDGVGFKFSAKPAGMVVYHNTIIAEHGGRDPHGNAHFRNNLFLGRDHPDRPVATFPNGTWYSTYDYNGYRPNPKAAANYVWFAPPKGASNQYDPAESEYRRFKTLAEFREATGQEAHGVEIDYGTVFSGLRAPDATQRHAVYHAADLDFTLRPAGKAVDAGLALPNINDGFTGKAPDLGALELGKPAPVYGPRWLKGKPFYR